MRVRHCLPLLICVVAIASNATAADKPNVLVILADDLGYSDLGCYGGEIQTPNIDSLAKNGLRFTQFYNTARCWPTRGALMTGYYAQQIRRDKIAGIVSGARGRRPVWARLLPDMLKPLGYRAYHSGKWHIDSMPIATGFDRSYYLGDQSRFFSPNRHWEDDKRLPAVKRGSGFYGTIAIANHAVKVLKDHAKNHAGKPFFHYLAFTAPHFPLHALPKDIKKYHGNYNAGWAKFRAARWKKQQALGIAKHSLSKVERNVGPPYHFPKAFKILGPGEVNRPLPWDKLTAEQKKFQATKMEIHAAMVDRMDQEIGRVLAQLRTMKALDNTLIFFLSDNGCSAEIMVRADGHDPKAAPGSAATYLCVGPGWSTTCNTPFRRHKTWVHEGGMCTPLVVHWPQGFSAKGELRSTVGHVIDIVPTILDVAGGKPFKAWKNTPVPKAPGKSLRPAFTKDGTVKRDHLWWSHEGNKALREGDWKLVRAKADGKWELFNLAKDRNETTDLAKKYPKRVRAMAAKWQHREDEFRKLVTVDRRLKKQRR